VAGQSTIEFQYDPLSEFPERAVKTRQHIKDNKIKPTDPRALIFLIPPGTKLVSYTTGTGGGRDQVQLNFTAPN
jgi:hypothetical protein